MLKTSLLEILRTFSKEELKRFDEFVYSPYFNKKSSVTKLWEVLKKFTPEFKDERLDRKIVWKKLFPGKEFNYGVMKNLIYDLSQLSERFLEEEIYIEEKYQREKNLLANLSRKDLSKILDSRYSAMKSKLVNSKGGPDRYEKLADLEWEYYSVLDNMNKKTGKNIFEISEYTIYNFLITMFKLFNNISAEKLTSKKSKESSLLEEFLKSLDIEYVMKFIKTNSYEDYKIINIYFDMYKAFSQQNVSESYFNFKNTLVQNEDLLTNYERRNLFSCLFTALAYNETIKHKSSEFNELNKIMHSKKILTDEDGFISIRDFSFGVRMAAMVKDIEFLEEFIQTYSKALRPSTMENMNLYGMAYLHFAKREFTRALELINKINFDLISFKFELKNLQLILFYEINDFDSLLYALDSYRHYASNNQFVSEVARGKILRFINYLNTLLKLNENPDNVKIELLKEKILNDTLVTKNWLLEKVGDIKEKLC